MSVEGRSINSCSPSVQTFAYGLAIDSDVPLGSPAPGPSAQCRAYEPDLRIRLGVVPEPSAAWHDSGTERAVRYRFGPEQMRLDVAGAGSISIQQGNHILAQPTTEDAIHELGSYLCGPALALALWQRGGLVMHGTTLSGPQGAMMLCGPSGAGKSTTAWAMAERGWDVVSDDISVINRDGAVPPGLGRIRLLTHVCDHFGLDHAGSARAHSFVQDKFVAALRPVAPEPVRLRSMVVLAWHPPGREDCPPEIEPITAGQRLPALHRQLYHPAQLRRTPWFPAVFARLGPLMEEVRLYRLLRPRGLDRLPGILDQIRNLP